MAESSIYDYVREGLQGKAFVHKHNDLAPGVPDLSVHIHPEYVADKHGRTVWIEAKAASDWPAKEDTKLRFAHYTEHQALWLKRRGGWLLIRVRRNYYLLDGNAAWKFWIRDGMTKEHLGIHATQVWSGGIKFLEFLRVIGS